MKLLQVNIEEPHYNYLRALLEEDGITQGELSERLDVVAPAVTGVLDRLAVLGLVRRVTDKVDRRKRRIFLTKKANALRAPLLALIARRNAALLDGICESDYEAFSRVLNRIVENALRDDAGELASLGADRAVANDA